jgi:ATP-binding cassette subfamily B (MDR/TAP) protein 1
VSVNEEMFVDQMDVTSAYVQGELSDEIYMKQPEMFVEKNRENMICKLNKPLYGLKQSGREWYRKLDNFLLNLGGRRTEANPCVYVFNENKSQVYL